MFDPHDSPRDGTGHTAEMRKRTHRKELGDRPRSHSRVGEHTGFELQNSDFKVQGLDTKPDADSGVGSAQGVGSETFISL